MRVTRWKKPTKYGNVRTVLDGITFDSRKEATRYLTLKALLKAGQITNVAVHPRFPLVVEGKKICDYVADFSYQEMPSGKTIVEDVKGVITPVAKLKIKLMLAIHDICVRIM